MALIIKLFGILIILSGISLLFYPEYFFGWVEDNMETTPFYIFVIVVRLAFGILFILAAKESKFPGVFKIIGSLAITVAIVFVLIGHESFNDFFTTLIPEIKPYAPVSGLFALALGGFLIYAFSKDKELE